MKYPPSQPKVYKDIKHWWKGKGNCNGISRAVVRFSNDSNRLSISFSVLSSELPNSGGAKQINLSNSTLTLKEIDYFPWKEGKRKEEGSAIRTKKSCSVGDSN